MSASDSVAPHADDRRIRGRAAHDRMFRRAGAFPRARASLASAIGTLALVAGLGGAANAQPQPTLPRVELQAGIHLIRAEVADEDPTRAKGLMFRERLGPNEGMLFIFESKSRQCFWMRNTLVALSIAFIDDDGAIANIEDMQPKTENSHCSARPIRYALEMEQGWFGKRGIKAGFRLSGPKGLFAPN